MTDHEQRPILAMDADGWESFRCGTISHVQQMIALAQRRATATWLLAVFACGALATAVVFLSHQEFLDCSNPVTHESADTPLGWSMAGLATLVPLGIGISLAVRHSVRLLVMAVVVAVVQAVVWSWALGGPGTCSASSVLA